MGVSQKALYGLRDMLLKNPANVLRFPLYVVQTTIYGLRDASTQK